MTTIPSSPPIVNLPAYNEQTEALRDLIAFAETQHQPRPCAVCHNTGYTYNIMAPLGEEEQPCRTCGGTGTVFPVANPLASLANITAAKALLYALYGGGKS